MSWTYNGELLNDEIIADNVGFVYLITNLTNNKKYIGKKLFNFTRSSFKTITLKNGTKKKKRIKKTVISDYNEYYGSSIELNNDVELIGKEHFKREILHLCKTKGAMSYLEAREQFDNRVLERLNDYYNRQIHCRIHHSHVTKITK